MNEFTTLEEMTEYDAWYLEQYERNFLNSQSTYQKEINKILRNRNKTFLRKMRSATFRNKILNKLKRLLGNA